MRKIEEQMAEFAGTIRTHVASQLEHWKQVPLLYLETHGKSGYSDNAMLVIRDKIWPFSTNIDGKYLYDWLGVNCNTGEIVLPGITGYPLASDQDVVVLGYCLELLDAKTVVELLRKKANEPQWDKRGPDGRKAEKRRQELREKYFSSIPV